MAGSAYTKRFIGGSAREKSLTATVPAGMVWVVRCVAAISSGAAHYDLWIAGVGAIVSLQLGVQGTWYYAEWQGRQAANAGEELQATFTPAGGFCLVTGYELAA